MPSSTSSPPAPAKMHPGSTWSLDARATSLICRSRERAAASVRRLEDHDFGLPGSPIGVVVRITAELAPPRPQALALLSHGCPRTDLPGAVLELDLGNRLSLQVEPPRRVR